MQFIQSLIYRLLWGVSDGVKSDLRKIGDNLQFITPIGVLLYGAFTGELKLLQVFILYYLGCTVIQVFLKWLFNNPRPNEIDTTVNPALTLDWSVNKGDSFPSGHTMSAVSGGVFWFNICGYMGVLGLVLGVFTAFTRLVVKAHWNYRDYYVGNHRSLLSQWNRNSTFNGTISTLSMDEEGIPSSSFYQ